MPIEKKRMGKMKRFVETADLFAFGAMAYCLCETLWCGKTHWTMGLLGGAMFVAIGMIDTVMPGRFGLLTQGLMGGALITAAEFASGCLLNIALGMNIWDYSAIPLNLLGQICLPYSALWAMLSVIAVVAEDAIRCFAWDEDMPRYKLL